MLYSVSADDKKITFDIEKGATSKELEEAFNVETEPVA
jgi:hypothetical protein